MQRKCNTIRSTKNFLDLIDELEPHSSPTQILLRSHHYVAAACDLSDPCSVEKVFDELKLHNFRILFVAEVSMTYMDIEAANRVILLSSRFIHSQFCLLEQWMPAGAHHPFASTMIKHFEKLGSPLKAPLRYQNARSLRQRFQENGWQTIDLRSLWSLWSDDVFLLPSERAFLDSIEQFDEWEEFALFSQHYFLLIAESASFNKASDQHENDIVDAEVQNLHVLFAPYPATEQLHRNSASFKIGKSIICQGGQGTRGRLSKSFIYSIDGIDQLSDRDTSKVSTISLPSAELMCHTITKLNDDTLVLVGGRTSPSLASQICYSGKNKSFEKAADLPQGLYRHCAVPVTIRPPGFHHFGVLVFGGKNSSGEIGSSWFLWWLGAESWQKLEVIGDHVPARFSAAMSVSPRNESLGHLCGGIGREGKILTDLWRWELICTGSSIRVKCNNLTATLESQNQLLKYFGRAGASLIERSSGLYLIGGVGEFEVISSKDIILKVDAQSRICPIVMDQLVPTPLLVGHCVVPIDDGQDDFNIALTGGGAVCFSFGTFWNTGSYLISNSPSNLRVQPWTVIATGSQQNLDFELSPNIQSTCQNPLSRAYAIEARDSSSEGEVNIPKVTISSSEEFDHILQRAHPVILKSLDLGRCTTAWNLDYLRQKIGDDREIVVHSSQTSQMDFLEKNFDYRKMRFSDFTRDIQAGRRLYLRSLSSEKPNQKPTSLTEDFPTIASDFRLPAELSYVTNNLHSSPFRISGPVTMWLHFDVMANVLCQIGGRKRLVLFSPRNADKLGFPNGASSSKFHIFDNKGKLRADVQHLQPMLCDLSPGDILFIPALWPHAAAPIDEVSIAVNVFFRSLHAGYSAGKDVYGNRDVQAYENARKDIVRIKRSFAALPEYFQEFYLKRIAAELINS